MHDKNKQHCILFCDYYIHVINIEHNPTHHAYKKREMLLEIQKLWIFYEKYLKFTAFNQLIKQTINKKDATLAEVMKVQVICFTSAGQCISNAQERPNINKVI